MSLFKDKFKSTVMSWLSLGGIAFAIYLVVQENISPGHCPPYPLFVWPACYLVLLFFIMVFAGSQMHTSRWGLLLMLVGSIVGLATATWFSAHNLLGVMCCPVLLGLPLCYAAWVTFLVLLVKILKIKKGT